MLKKIAIAAMVFFTILSPLSMAQQHVIRGPGDACGQDSKYIASCGAGLSCKSGNCEFDSYLSGATVGCKEEMKKRTGYTGYVAVHDGFCYVNNSCRAMYDAAMDASEVVGKVLTTPNDPKLQKKLIDSLSDSEQASYDRAVNTCKACGDSCAMGAGFLGRGGY